MKRAVMLLTLLLMLAPCAALAQGIDLAVSPSGLDIGATYNGSSVSVTGAVPPGSQLVLRFVGAAEDLKMKKKDKALGLLWMNMDTVHITGAPKVFLVQSSSPLFDLGDAGVELGLAGIEAKTKVEPVASDRATLVPELVKLKASEGLYREKTGNVLIAADGKFEAHMAIPSRLSPGTYTVEAFAVKDGKVAAQGKAPFEAKLVGIPAQMADLAFNHGAWYGILASVVAILAGLAIGMVFQSKDAH